MAQPILDLLHAIRSKKMIVTTEEINVLEQQCTNRMIRAFPVGAATGAAAAFFVKPKLHILLRLKLAAAFGLATGLHRFQKSCDRCIEHILNLDGSLLQHELAEIMLRKYQDNQSRMRRMSKHFYPENVIDDSSTDLKPKLRWRHRMFFGDGAPHFEGMHDNYSYRLSSGVETEPVHMDGNVDAAPDDLDTFDCVFGIQPTSEELDSPASSTTSP